MIRTIIAVAAAVFLPATATATYSIVGTDPQSGEIGGAGTSCVGPMDVYAIYGGAPGYGVVHAQAWLNDEGRLRAVELLAQGVSPEDILAEITDETFDASASIRQYGIADLQGRAAAFTGEDNSDYAGDAQGTVGAFTYSAQGNILTSEAVITQAVAGFEGEGCDLAERLMMALEAGGENGEGDSRCANQGIPADSAFIHVDLQDGTELLHLSVTDTSPDNPLVELRALFDAWRVDNPCPGDPGDPGDDDDAADDDDVADDDDIADDDDTGSAGDDDDVADDDVDDEGGCSCGTSGRGRGGWWVVLLLASVLTSRIRCVREVDERG